MTLQGHEIIVYNLYCRLNCLMKTHYLKEIYWEDKEKCTDYRKIPEFSPRLKNKYYRFYAHYTRNRFLKIQRIFSEMFEKAWKKVCNIAKGKDYRIIIDSYIEQSIKECEKIKRSDAELAEFTNPEINSPIVSLHPQEYFIAKSKSIQKYNS